MTVCSVEIGAPRSHQERARLHAEECAIEEGLRNLPGSLPTASKPPSQASRKVRQNLWEGIGANLQSGMSFRPAGMPRHLLAARSSPAAPQQLLRPRHHIFHCQAEMLVDLLV